MSDGFYLALGVTVVLPFLQWLRPIMPKSVAWAGVIAGCTVMLADFLEPAMRPPLSSTLLFLVAALCLGGAIHLYIHRNDAKKPRTPTTSQDSGNRMGNIGGNKGIVTKGKKGDNTIYK